MGWRDRAKRARDKAKKMRAEAKEKAPRLTKKLLKKMTTAQLKKLEDMVADELVERNTRGR